MTNIYDLHDKAFANVSAFIIVKDGQQVAKIAFKFPRDGAGRLYAYVHWIGIEMVRGHAGGYGYDKRSAAVASAVQKAIATIKPAPDDVNLARTTFFRVLQSDGGEHWDRKLRDAGFEVWQAV